MRQNEAIRPVWGHLEYVWKLENLWELRALASIEALEDDAGDVIWSSRFGDQSHGIWRLKLYPYGDSSAGGKGNISLFLALDTKLMDTKKAYAIFCCHVLDGKGEQVADYGRSFTRQRFAEHSCSWGWSHFIKVDGQSLSKVLINDSLCLKCVIDVYVGTKTSADVQIQKALTFSEQIQEYAENAKSPKVKLVCDDGRSFDVSRFVLCARAKRFRSLLTDGGTNFLASDPKLAHKSAYHDINKSAPGQSYTSFSGSVAANDKKVDKQITNSPPEITVKAAKSNIPIEDKYSEISDNANANDTSADTSNSPVVYLEGLLPEAAEQMVLFINTDSCPVLEEFCPSVRFLADVLVAAHRYCVESLVRKISSAILTHITNEQDAEVVYQTAKSLNLEVLCLEISHVLRSFSPAKTKSELLAGAATR